MGVGGALFAHHIRFVSPLTFDPLLGTFIIWAMLMVGGSGNNLGAILGAFVVWGLWVGARFLPGELADPNFRFFMVGVLIVAVILLRPGGILGELRRVTRRRNGQIGRSARRWLTTSRSSFASRGLARVSGSGNDRGITDMSSRTRLVSPRRSTSSFRRKPESSRGFARVGRIPGPRPSPG